MINIGEIKKFIKFGIVGASGVIVNLAIYIPLIKINLDYNIAATIAFCFAVSNNFYWNFKWTFKGEAEEKSVSRKYTEFFIISLINFTVNITILNIFIRLFKTIETILILANYNEIIAQIIAIGITMVLNFIGNNMITFKDSKKQEER